MANEYQIVYPRTGATVEAQVFRGNPLASQETIPVVLNEDDTGIYAGDAGIALQAGDLIVYIDADLMVIIGRETYRPESTPVGVNSSLVIPAGYIGDYRQHDKVYFTWKTLSTPSVAGTIKVYRDNNTDEITIPTGITDTRSFDGQTNVNQCVIDLSSNTFYKKSADYSVILSGSTIDGKTLNAVIATFSIENRFSLPTFTRDG